MCFTFMAAITVCIDYGAQENKTCHCFHFSPSIRHEVMGLDAMILAVTGGKYDLVAKVPSALVLPRLHQKNSFGWLIITGHDRALWLAVKYPPSLIVHQQIPYC